MAIDKAALLRCSPHSRTCLQESVLCIPTDRRLPKLRLRSRQLHRLLGQVGEIECQEACRLMSVTRRVGAGWMDCCVAESVWDHVDAAL